MQCDMRSKMSPTDFETVSKTKRRNKASKLWHNSHILIRYQNLYRRVLTLRDAYVMIQWVMARAESTIYAWPGEVVVMETNGTLLHIYGLNVQKFRDLYELPILDNSLSDADCQSLSVYLTDTNFA
eukprot:143900_1